MSNEDIVKKFLTCYQAHNFRGMHNCLDENVTFSDFAFNIQGEEVKAMWHWFCMPYGKREKPIEIPEFAIVKSEDNSVQAKYRVKYFYGDKQKPVDYFIKSDFRLNNEKIIDQQDNFDDISEYQFAQQAFGFPLQLLAFTPLLRILVKKEATKKLKQFMKEVK
jgi:hypothetical protein